MKQPENEQCNVEGCDQMGGVFRYRADGYEVSLCGVCAKAYDMGRARGRERWSE